MAASVGEDLIRRPHPGLRAHLGDYVGYDVSGVPAGTHLGLPSGALTFIVTIGEPLHQVIERPDSRVRSRVGHLSGPRALAPGASGAGASESGSLGPESFNPESFNSGDRVQACDFDVLIAGLHLRRTLIRHRGAMAGIQINFGPFAPRALFGMPAAEFAHSTYDLADIAAPVARELHERVNLAQTWPERFDAIDEVLCSLIRSDTPPDDTVRDSWRMIAAARGRLPVADVAAELGWSRRHLSARFLSELGIGPKDAARVLRFDRARRMISSGAQSLASVAVMCGYADQPHLNREFRALTGTNPTGWLREDPVAAASHLSKTR